MRNNYSVPERLGHLESQVPFSNEKVPNLLLSKHTQFSGQITGLKI